MSSNVLPFERLTSRRRRGMIPATTVGSPSGLAHAAIRTGLSAETPMKVSDQGSRKAPAGEQVRFGSCRQMDDDQRPADPEPPDEGCAAARFNRCRGSRCRSTRAPFRHWGPAFRFVRQQSFNVRRAPSSRLVLLLDGRLDLLPHLVGRFHAGKQLAGRLGDGLQGRPAGRGKIAVFAGEDGQSASSPEPINSGS